jgi:hypothetical protein
MNLSRRDILKLTSAGLISNASVPWFENMAHAGIQRPRGKACILLWMDGGPSQQHTFDPKPEGEFKSIPTTVPGIHVTEKFPKLAHCMKDMVFLRSMTTQINEHYDAKYYLHTGFRRVTGLEHPSIGSIASSQVGLPDDEMPAFVTIDAGNDKGNGGRFYRSVPAYLGAEHAPLSVQHPEEGLENLHSDSNTLDQRLQLLAKSENSFAQKFGVPSVLAKQAALKRAVQLMKSPRAAAFNLDSEPEYLKDQYGRHRFGQSCLLARRLVESGVSFVEVFHRGWDDHEGAGKRIGARAPWMDAGMSALILDLKTRGMLDDVLIVWMGEFGRSPGDGNGHFCRAWTTALAGGGIKTGQVVGKTSEGGKNPGGDIVERPISAPDFIATICTVLGIDTHQEFLAAGNRPMPIVEKDAKVVTEILA